MSAIYDGVYAVVGPPGTGKTTYIARQTERVVEAGSSPVLCSLTRTAALEIASRIPQASVPDERIGTLHSLAWRAVGRRIDREDGERVIGDADAAEFSERYPALAFRVAHDTREIDDAERIDGGLPGQDLYRRSVLLRHDMRPIDEWEPDVAAFYRKYRSFMAERGLIDFTDMLEAALLEAAVSGPPKGFDAVLIDEAQDFSRLELALAKSWARDGALFIVGDPLQSLYSWRGATPEVFEGISDDRLKILSRSHRVPRRIRDAALEWIRRNHSNTGITTDYKYEPRRNENGAEVEGAVEYTGIRSSDTEAVVSLAREVERSGKTLMIAAQCAYMLRPIVRALRSSGIMFANPWRPDNGEWNPISARGISTYERVRALIDPVRERRIWTFAEAMLWAPLVSGVFALGAVKNIESRGKAREQRAIDPLELREAMRDPYEADILVAIAKRGDMRGAMNWLMERARRATRERIEYALAIEARRKDSDDPTPRVYVGTVHSYKGGEADTVLMFPDISRAAAEDIETRGQAARDAVARTVYVGMTRARERLLLGAPINERRAVDWQC